MRKIGIFFGLALLSVICLEAGLQTRSWLDDWISNSLLKSDSKNSILLIGDSILGLGSEHTPSGYIAKEIATRSASLSVVNLCAPANNTNRVTLLIDDYLEKYKPKVVVLLLGKSDAPTANSRITANAKTEETLTSKIKVFRLSWLIEQKLKATFARASFGYQLFLSSFRRDDGPRESDLNAEFAELDRLDTQKDYSAVSAKLETMHESGSFAEACYSSAYSAQLQVRMGKREEARIPLAEASRCLQSMQDAKSQWFAARISSLIGATYKDMGDIENAKLFFQKAIQAMPEYSRAYSDMGWMYFNNEDCVSAIDPLEKSLRIGEHWPTAISALYKCYLRESKFEHGARFFRELAQTSRFAGRLEDLAAILERDAAADFSKADLEISENPMSREQYFAALWLHARLKQPAEALRLYRRLDEFQFSHAPLNRQAFSEIVRRLSDQNVTTVILQYPNSSAIPWLDEFTIDPRVHIVSLREIILSHLQDGGRPTLFDLFQSDFEHFSDEGAQIAGHAIAEELAKLDLVENK